jgi:probable HAF family extracellular repeat protein
MAAWGALALLVAGLTAAPAQPYSRLGSVVAGGGGAGGNSQYVLTATAGQPVTGVQSDGHFTLQGGFWTFSAAALGTSPPPTPNILVWTNLKGGRWNVAANWNPNQVPGPHDTAIIDLRSTYTVSLTNNQTVGNLTLGAGATLASSYTNGLNVLGAFTWTGGSLYSNLRCSGGTVSGTNIHAQTGCLLVNAGWLRLSASITTASSAVVTNLAGAVLELTDDVGFIYSAGPHGAIINQGTLLKTGGIGKSMITEPFINAGLVELHSGTLELGQACVQNNGATRVLEGQLQLDQWMLLAGGALNATNLITGTVTNSGGTVAPAVSPGAMQINGRYVQTSGGTLAIQLGGTRPGTDFDVLTVNGVAKVAGTLAVTAVSGFRPLNGTIFEFLDAAACSGGFGNFSPALTTLGLVVVYAPDHVALSVGMPLTNPLPQYSGVDLVGLSTVGCLPQAINDQGQVVGSSPVAGSTHAFLYDHGTIRDLGTLAGPGSWAYGINNAGHVVGWSTITTNSVPYHAFCYDGTMHDLGTLGGATDSSYGYGINDNDEIIGYSYFTTHGGQSVRPFLYQNGTMIKLPDPLWPDHTEAGAYAYGLNNNLQIVGYGPKQVGAGHGFVYDYLGGSALDVGDLGGSSSTALAINHAGQATGYAATEGNAWDHAFLFDGRIHDLGTLGGNSQGFAINRRGQVVGTYQYLGNGVAPHACLWSGGQIIDLNYVIPPNSGWELREATGINDRGQIVGNASRQGFSGWRGFLLTPLPAIQLAVVPGGGLVLVWGIENQGFTLQENTALSPSGWVNLNVTPTVTGNQVRVVLPQPTSNRFYRLMQP